MNLVMNIREVDGEKDVNCLGYFSSKFFSFNELMQLQKDIKNLIKAKEEVGSNTDETIKWFDVTEYMRVKLLTSK